MNERDVLLDVGKLAGLVAGQLNAIDKNTTNHNSHGGFANKININQFINSIKQNSLPPPVHSTLAPTFVPVLVDEVEVQNLEPDTSQFSVKIGSPSPIQQSFHQEPRRSSQREEAQTNTPVTLINHPSVNTTELIDDIKAIKSTLTSINSTFTKISGMMGKVFNYITEKERKNNKS